MPSPQASPEAAKAPPAPSPASFWRRTFPFPKGVYGRVFMIAFTTEGVAHGVQMFLEVHRWSLAASLSVALLATLLWLVMARWVVGRGPIEGALGGVLVQVIACFFLIWSNLLRAAPFTPQLLIASFVATFSAVGIYFSTKPLFLLLPGLFIGSWLGSFSSSLRPEETP